MLFKWLRIALVSKCFGIGAAVLAEAGIVGTPDVHYVSMSSYPFDTYEILPVFPTMLASAFAMTADPSDAPPVAEALMGDARVEAAGALCVVNDSPSRFATPPFGQDGVWCMSLVDGLLAHIGVAGWLEAEQLRQAGAVLLGREVGLGGRDVVAGFVARPGSVELAVNLLRAQHGGFRLVLGSVLVIVFCVVALICIILASECPKRAREWGGVRAYARAGPWVTQFYRVPSTRRLRGGSSRFVPQG